MQKNKTLFFVLVVMEVCLEAVPAHAYLDAGTGSMLLQLLLGGVAGLVVIFKLYWQKIVSIFSKNVSDKIEEDAVQENKNRGDGEQ